MSSIKFLLILLFFPVWLVFWLGWWIYHKFWGKKQQIQAQKEREFKQKWREHLRNFDPSRVKNRTWQKSLSKSKKRGLKNQKN